MANCHPEASVSVTTAGMISTILGVSLMVSSTRAGTDMLPMIGPRIRPRKRSMIVQAAPPATWKNSSGHSLLTAIATISRTIKTAEIAKPTRGTISKSGLAAAGRGLWRRGGGAVVASSVIVSVNPESAGARITTPELRNLVGWWRAVWCFRRARGSRRGRRADSSWTGQSCPSRLRTAR